MKPKIDALYQEWQQATRPRQRDRLLAEALGGTVSEGEEPRVQWHHPGLPKEEPLPPYTANLIAAAHAMDQAWDTLEEFAPHQIHCRRNPDNPKQRGDCFVEWWPDDENHVVTPHFATEAEGRAFAAFAFARLEREV